MEPCGWAANTDCVPGWDAFSAETKAEATGTAEMIVWALSGRQFGVCDRVVRPCGPPRRGSLWWEINAATMGYGYMVPYRDGGQWLNAACGCTGGCSCTELGGIMLPGPIDEVTEVILDGVILGADEYVLVGEKLVRTDGTLWPLCQNMALPDTEPGTWSVAYGQGLPVPFGGNLAAGKLAGELAKACEGQDCALPERVTEITREGVTMTLLDPQEFLEEGRTGIALVDQWIAAVNPYKHRSPATVWSPDLQKVQTRR
jgi:hypothetical protein